MTIELPLSPWLITMSLLFLSAISAALSCLVRFGSIVCVGRSQRSCLISSKRPSVKGGRRYVGVCKVFCGALKNGDFVVVVFVGIVLFDL